MKFRHFLFLLTAVILASCGGNADDSKPAVKAEVAPEDMADTDAYTHPIGEKDVVVGDDGFTWQTERFADIRIVRYQIPGWDELSERQQKLAYYLTQAGLSGRDMMYDQNYRHNLEIRNTLENIYTNYTGDKGVIGWHRFETYLKRIWFANGIHHHYSNSKFIPEFGEGYFDELLAATGGSITAEARRAIFDADFDNKKVERDAEKGLVENSAINFYAPGVTTEEAQAYFESIKDTTTRTPVEYGLNSRLIKNANGEIEEEVYKVGGLYGEALEQVVYWLRLAETVAENDRQASVLRNLCSYYETGDLRTWDNFNINWVAEREGDIDFINGFIEVYNDPLGKTGSYETIVEIKDFEASKRMTELMDNAQWFEDNSPILDIHKKAKVTGISYTVVNVVGEAGDASPSTPIGVNLPNSDWIKAIHGSKSVSLGNILDGYEKSSGSGLLKAFAHDEKEIELSEAHGDLAGKLHTAMHEVIGHASGQSEEGAESLENYASTIEEGRADLVALYFLLDPKLVELGLMESLDVGIAEYDSYIRNGMLAQLRRLDLGDDIEEAHMRNRAWVAHWVYEKGEANNVIAKVERDGNLYYDIQDYEALKGLFGDLLQEVQRIKSQGDYEAAKALVEGYGVKVDQTVHAQVLARAEALGTAPYGGFINPLLSPQMDEDGNVASVKVDYPDDFAKQMLYYSEKYGFLSK